jgi:hypothetical protein
VADAGHELRTPLTSMRTNLELLLASERPNSPTLSDEDKKEINDDVRAQLDELTTLIGDLVELARDEVGLPQDDLPPVQFEAPLRRGDRADRRTHRGSQRLDGIGVRVPLVERADDPAQERLVPEDRGLGRERAEQGALGDIRSFGDGPCRRGGVPVCKAQLDRGLLHRQPCAERLAFAAPLGCRRSGNTHGGPPSRRSPVDTGR